MGWFSKDPKKDKKLPSEIVKAEEPPPPPVVQTRTIRIAIRTDNVTSHVVVTASSTLSAGDLESILERPARRLAVDLGNEPSEASLLGARIALAITLKEHYPQAGLEIKDLRVEAPKP